MYYMCLFFTPQALDAQCKELSNHEFVKAKKIEFCASHSLKASTVEFEVNQPDHNSGWQWDAYKVSAFFHSP